MKTGNRLFCGFIFTITDVRVALNLSFLSALSPTLGSISFRHFFTLHLGCDDVSYTVYMYPYGFFIYSTVKHFYSKIGKCPISDERIVAASASCDVTLPALLRFSDNTSCLRARLTTDTLVTAASCVFCEAHVLPFPPHKGNNAKVFSKHSASDEGHESPRSNPSALPSNGPMFTVCGFLKWHVRVSTTVRSRRVQPPTVWPSTGCQTVNSAVLNVGSLCWDFLV